MNTLLDFSGIAVPVIRCRPFHHAMPDDLTEIVMTANADVLGIGVHHPPFVVQNQVSRVGGFDQLPILRLAFCKSRFRLHSLGDITEDTHRTGSSIVSQELADDLRIEYASILA